MTIDLKKILLILLGAIIVMPCCYGQGLGTRFRLRGEDPAARVALRELSPWFADLKTHLMNQKGYKALMSQLSNESVYCAVKLDKVRSQVKFSLIRKTGRASWEGLSSFFEDCEPFRAPPSDLLYKRNIEIVLSTAGPGSPVVVGAAQPNLGK